MPDGTRGPPVAPICKPCSQSLHPGCRRNETTKSFLETACDESCLFVLKVEIDRAIKIKSLFWQRGMQEIFA